MVDIGMGLCIGPCCIAVHAGKIRSSYSLRLKSVTPLFTEHGIVNLPRASAQAAMCCDGEGTGDRSLARRTMGPKTQSSNESVASRGSHSSRNLGDRQREEKEEESERESEKEGKRKEDKEERERQSYDGWVP